MKKTLLHALFLLLIFSSASQAERNKDTSCRFKHDSCETSETVKDVHPEDQMCFNQSLLWIKLDYLDCTSHVSDAWMHLYKNDVLGGSEPDELMNILKYRALYYPHKDNHDLQVLIEKYNLDLPKIEKMFIEAIEWAEKEKQKTADELYSMANSASLDTLYKDQADSFRSLYISMASRKGYEPTREEIPETPDTLHNKSLHNIPSKECDGAYRKISRADPAGYVTLAYLAYCSSEYKPKDQDRDRVKTILYAASLYHSKDDNIETLKTIEDSNVSSSEFIEMYKSAIKWAEKEKQKTADELYNSAHTTPSYVVDSWKGFNKKIYLMLAARKGHAQAQKELTESGISTPLPPL